VRLDTLCTMMLLLFPRGVLQDDQMDRGSQLLTAQITRSTAQHGDDDWVVSVCCTQRA